MNGFLLEGDIGSTRNQEVKVVGKMIQKCYLFAFIFLVLILMALTVPVVSQPGQQLPRPNNFAQWTEDAINWGELHLNSYDWWDSANQQGYCLRFVSNAFMQKKVAGASGFNTALEAANALYRFNREPGGWQYAPKGVIIFFDKDGKNKDGHVGIYLGGGRILNAYGKVQEFTIDEAIAKPDIGQYIGWSYPPEAWRPAFNTDNSAKQVTLTLYVHDESAGGPVIPGAKVIGKDGSGNSFQQITDNSGYVTITGIAGTWSFSASSSGYETNNWDQDITVTCAKHAFLQNSGNSVVGRWLIKRFDEWGIGYKYTTFRNDGTLTRTEWQASLGGQMDEWGSGEWTQFGDNIRWEDDITQIFEGKINGDTISGIVSYGNPPESHPFSAGRIGA